MPQEHRDRHGRSWHEDDYAQIITGLREGLDDDALAGRLGRTTGAVRARAKYLVSTPEDMVLGRLDTETTAELRERVCSDPSLAWHRHARAWHEFRGLPFLDAALDDLLRTAWADGEPRLPRISADTGVREQELAERIIDLDLAATREEVVDRLGCTPGNALARSLSRPPAQLASTRAEATGPRAALDAGTTRDGAPDDADGAHLSSPADEEPQRPGVSPVDEAWVLIVHSREGIQHVSLHPSREAAALALIDADTTAAAASGAVPYRWAIAHRTLGAGDAGTVERGMHLRDID